MALVSVIMNCFNSTRYLREAIDSVYAQTHDDWEIILWDNASTENVKSFLFGYDARIRYFRGEQTVPLGAARNLAMEQILGDYIAFLDCDDVWLQDKLERQIADFKNPKVGLSYTDWILFNDKGGEHVRYGEMPAPSGKVFEKALFTNFTCLSSLVVRAELVLHEKISFDPQFTYLEDTDFIIRIARNWEFAYVPAALTKYRMHANSCSATKKQGFRDEHELMADKYKTLFPDFYKYEDEIRANIVRDRAMDEWRDSHGRAARRLLRGLIFKNWRYPIIYLLFFLPASWVDGLRRKFSNAVTYHY